MRFLSIFKSATGFFFQLQERRLLDAQSVALLIDITANVVWSGSFVQLGELSWSALASGDLLAGKYLLRPAQPGGLGSAAFESVLSNSVKEWKQGLYNVLIFVTLQRRKSFIFQPYTFWIANMASYRENTKMYFTSDKTVFNIFSEGLFWGHDPSH